MTTGPPACPVCGLRGCGAPARDTERVGPHVLAAVRRALEPTPPRGLPLVTAVAPPAPRRARVPAGAR